MKQLLDFAYVVLVVFSLCVIPVSAMAQETATETETTPVAISDVEGKSVAVLTPENTRIEFVGTHVGEDPKPRLGGFKDFKGTVGVEDGKPVSVNIEIDIASVWTEFDKLTAHLMNSDFFETENFPSATFKSTSIEVSNEKCTIAGELTLHGTTSSIEFTGKFKMEDGGLVLMSDFKLDRTQFGMDQMTDGVEEEVSLSVVVGQATRGVESKEGHGGDSEDQAATESSSMKGTTVKINLPGMS